ncbi:MAG: GrdX family protein [Lachnospiraceae bacterium]
MKFQIITNNPLVYEELKNEYEMLYLDITYKQILFKVRDMCHLGHKLLSHPLSGSVKPNETPYKSVMVSLKKEKIDIESIAIIENCIASCDKFEDLGKHWSEKVLDDFRLIDYTLISSGIASAMVV